MTATIQAAAVRKRVSVRANRDKAFEVFTAGISGWWPKSHSLLKAPLDQVVVEPRVGGRWFHRGIDGSECENGRVLVWAPPERIVLGWQLNGRWEYEPEIVSEVEVRFIQTSADTTDVELEHRGIERFGETAAALRAGVDSAEGWPLLLQLFSARASGEANPGAEMA